MPFRQLCNIHGMLEFNKVEENIIRHPSFNRLADVKQLGYTYKGAYKCASHSRLSHSLGVAYLAKKILNNTIEETKDLINAHTDKVLEISVEDLEDIKKYEDALSVAALLHDINHVPFAHAIQTHFKYSEQNELIELGESFEQHIDEFKICPEVSPNLLEQVKCILIKTKHKNFKYGKLFYDIIRSDIGASTIDFVSRDYYEAGHGRLPLFRLLDSFVFLKESNGGIRIVLNLIQANENLTSVYHLLYSRYKLSETVYFHHTNVSAEAMIGKAFRRLIQNDKGKYNSFVEFIRSNNTDFRFYSSLLSSEDLLVGSIGSQLESRRLYDIGYVLAARDISATFKHFICQSFQGRDSIVNCTNFENFIANELALDPEDIIVHCCDENMYAFDIKDLLIVNESIEPKTFETAERTPIEPEFTAIKVTKELHEKLWKLYVLINRKNVFSKNHSDIVKLRELCSRVLATKQSLKSKLDEFSVIAQLESKSLVITPSELTIDTSLKNRKFKVGLSYSSKRKEYVKEIKDNLEKLIGTDSVFFYHDFESILAKPNADQEIINIFKNNCELVVIIHCSEYVTQFCGIELKVARELASKGQSNKVMLCKFDQTEVDTFSSLDGHYELQGKTAETVGKNIYQRLNDNLSDLK